LLVVTLRAEDVPATVHFYRDVVGLSLLPHHGPRPAFALGHGCHLVIAPGQPARAADPEADHFPAIALRVADLDAAVEHLKQHGVDLPWGIEAKVGTRWVIFADPAGNLVELAESAA
jgi:glyoxylase I family protein